MMIRSLALATGAALLLSLTASSARLNAQEPVLEEFYGSGVHQYFSGNYGRAIADLDAAINAGSRDPRAYYFRGLAKLRGGYGGEADLQRGAALEASDTDQYYPVSDSLERIQGSTRQMIERYRSLARANAFALDQKRNAARYQQLKEREQHVLRGPAPSAVPATAIEPAAAPPKAVAKPDVPPPPVPEPPAAEDPFAEKVAAPAPAAPAAAPAADMPAASPPAAAEPELADDPFGEPPSADAPAAKPAAAPADDPFATPPASPTDDPFGAPPASADDPFGSP